MIVLLTGATGFIGKRLVSTLTRAGHEVLGLSRDPDRAHVAVPAVSRFFFWQPQDPPPVEAIVLADVVVHLAGESVAGRWTAAKKRSIYDSRVVGTRNLVRALASAGRGRTLISTSAVGYYGDRADEELTESSLPGHGFLADVTQAWEAEALQATQTGNRVCIMRLGIVLGAEGGALKQMLPLFRLGLGGPLGNGRQWWPWVHIDDVATAFQSSVADARQGIFNVTAPQPLRQRDFARVLAAGLRRPAIARVPGFALRLAQGEFADELLFSKRVLPAALLGAGFQFSYPDLAAAFTQLVGQEGRGATLPSRA